MDAFDTDVLIYAVDPDHPYFGALRELFFPKPTPALPDAATKVGVGSVLLHVEALSRPIRLDDQSEILDLARLLVRLELLPTTETTAKIATSLAASYRLRAADAVHLATAIEAGADRFITNNRRDFGKDIAEIEITYPEDIAASST